MIDTVQLVSYKLCFIVFFRDTPMNDGYSQLKGMQYDSDSDDSSDYGMDVKDLAKGLADARKESKVNTKILCEN